MSVRREAVMCLCVGPGLNYLQSVTPRLSMGGEAFWLGQQRKSGTGFAARLHDENSVATAQVASTGLVSLAYMHRVSDKVRSCTQVMLVPTQLLSPGFLQSAHRACTAVSSLSSSSRAQMCL